MIRPDTNPCWMICDISATAPGLISRSQFHASFNTWGPTNRHMIVLIHTFRYLSGTIYHGIVYQKTPDEPLCSYGDGDYGAARDRHSTAEHVHTSFSARKSWMSKKQVTIAVSTCEAEYLAGSQALQEALWLRRMLADIHPRSEDSPTAIHVEKHERSFDHVQPGQDKVAIAHYYKRLSSRALH